MKDLIYHTTQGKFDICVYAHYDELDWECIKSHDEAYDTELSAKLDKGDLVAFNSEVVVSINGIRLGTSWLGGHVYEDARDYAKDTDYLIDQIDDAMNEAKTNLRLLGVNES